MHLLPEPVIGVALTVSSDIGAAHTSYKVWGYTLAKVALPLHWVVSRRYGSQNYKAEADNKYLVYRFI